METTPVQKKDDRPSMTVDELIDNYTTKPAPDGAPVDLPPQVPENNSTEDVKMEEKVDHPSQR